jgi:hypothetical protein
VEYRGLVAHLARASSPARIPKGHNLLHLLNPFAPASFGTGDSGPAGWCQVAGRRSVPRGFQEARTHEPQGMLMISISR